ncbi:MAG: hypothetical protein WCO55_00435 [Candidatus Falkowbacteria bacterium]
MSVQIIPDDVWRQYCIGCYHTRDYGALVDMAQELDLKAAEGQELYRMVLSYFSLAVQKEDRLFELADLFDDIYYRSQPRQLSDCLSPLEQTVYERFECLLKRIEADNTSEEYTAIVDGEKSLSPGLAELFQATRRRLYCAQLAFAQTA